VLLVTAILGDPMSPLALEAEGSHNDRRKATTPADRVGEYPDVEIAIPQVCNACGQQAISVETAKDDPMRDFDVRIIRFGRFAAVKECGQRLLAVPAETDGQRGIGLTEGPTGRVEVSG
jgi:hypothetical protein